MKEKTLILKFKKYLKEEYGATCHKYYGGPFSEAGVADLFGTLPNGRAYYIEVKVPGNKPTPIQEAFLANERKNGAVAGVARTLEDIDNLLA
jgi:hypothetical protein